MDVPTSGNETQGKPEAGNPPEKAHSATRTPSIIVAVVAAVVVGLSIFYLLRPEPLLVQGEVDATRLDIAARVDGRVKEIPVERGQNVAASAVLVRIDNPETHGQARSGEGRKGGGRRPACKHSRRNARGGHRRAQGGDGAGAGSPGPGAKDLRPHPQVGRARQRAAGPARPGDRCVA